jgi:hypothetical protein
MILYIHSNTYYLSENEAKSRRRGLFYMGSDTKTDKNLNKGAILIISKALKNVLLSAAEAEIGSSPQDNIGGNGAQTAPNTNGNG